MTAQSKHFNLCKWLCNCLGNVIKEEAKRAKKAKSLFAVAPQTTVEFGGTR
jgi:hypothetical protein